MGSGSAIRSSTLSLLKPSVGVLITSSPALITSIAILIKNEYNSKMKKKHTELGDWILVHVLLYDKTTKHSRTDKAN